MLFLRVSFLEILIVVVVVFLIFAPLFLRRDAQRVRSKVQLLEHTLVSQKACVWVILGANIVLLLSVLYFMNF